MTTTDAQGSPGDRLAKLSCRYSDWEAVVALEGLDDVETWGDVEEVIRGLSGPRLAAVLKGLNFVW